MARQKRGPREAGGRDRLEGYEPYKNPERSLAPERVEGRGVRPAEVETDPAAIEAARARALASSTEAPEIEEGFGETMWENTRYVARKGKDLGVGSVKVAVGASAALGFLGYTTSRPFARGLVIGIDWLAHKMNKWADKLIDKNVFLLKYLLNPTVSILDGIAKSFGLDKTLADLLKKKAEDRKKIAEKLLKDFREAEKKHEKKLDDAAKKKGREKKLKEILGDEAGAAVFGEMEEIESKEAPAAATPAPTEAPKAA